MSEHVAGRDLDALIAERVMGWTVNRTGDRHWHTVGATGRERGVLIGTDCCAEKWAGSFCPSRDIRDAFDVATKIGGLELQDVTGNGHWEARFAMSGDWDAAETAPLAICRAALLAVPALEQEQGTT